MLRYLTLTIIIELICFTVALICLLKDNNLAWKGMVLYLFITCITELIGVYIVKNTQSQNNQWVYNIFLLFEAGFTHLMFAALLSKYINSKPTIIIGFALIALVYLYEIYNNSFLIYAVLTYTIMSVLFVLYSLYYFYLLIKEDNYINLKYSDSFWWVTGALFFYFGNTGCNIFDEKLDNVTLFSHHLNYYIFRVLNLILYGCWSYSFICRKWLTRTSKN